MNADLSFRSDPPRREYRAGRQFELRVVGEEDDAPVLEGYASVFNEGYEVHDWLGPFTEVIEPGAFTKTLAEKADVRLLVNHEGLPLARTRSGTLSLAADEVGLRVEARLDPSDPDVAALAPKMRRGDLDEMSFAFRAIKDQWSEDWSERHVKEVELFDVSVVTFPANPATSAWMRMAQLDAELARLAEGDLAVMRGGGDPGLALRLSDRIASIAARPARNGEPAPGFPLSLAQAQAELLRLRRPA